MQITFKSYFSISLSVFFLLWILMDFFLGNKILNSFTKQDSVMKQLDQGWYELKSNYSGNEVFGNLIFREITDAKGFRVGEKYPQKRKAVFLGDSFMHGVGVNYAETIPGQFETLSGISSLNGGVPSYSPTAYLYNYQKAENANSLSREHLVIIGIDLSDIQDEAVIWRDGSHHPVKITNKKSGSEYATQIIDTETVVSIRATYLSYLSRKLPLSYRIYVILQQRIISPKAAEQTGRAQVDSNVPSNQVLNLTRSASTWVNWAYLNEPKLNAYYPLGVEGGLSRIESKLEELTRLAQSRGGQVFIFTYPWPAQIFYNSKEKFAFNKWVEGMCLRVKCDGYIPVYEEFLREALGKSNWYSSFYIIGDVHFNPNGNRLVSEILYEEIGSFISTGR